MRNANGSHACLVRENVTHATTIWFIRRYATDLCLVICGRAELESQAEAIMAGCVPVGPFGIKVSRKNREHMQCFYCVTSAVVRLPLY